MILLQVCNLQALQHEKMRTKKYNINHKQYNMTDTSEEIWNSDQYRKNAEINIEHVKNTIDDITLDFDKVMVCGRSTESHPSFHPRFSTPSSNVESELYVIVDHNDTYIQHIKRGGNYALSLIVHPSVVKEISKKNGKIFWFSPDYFQNDLPKIIQGKFPIGNSGLSEISIATYKNIKNILLSGINLKGDYSIFTEGKDLVFKYAKDRGRTLYSLDGILAQKISYDDWLRI